MPGSEPTPSSIAPAEPRGARGDYPVTGELRVAAGLLGELIAKCRAGLPNESCGLAAGSDGEITHLFPLANTASSPIRYEVDPLEQLDAYHAIADAGLDVLAVYHSHPATPARPSRTDIAEAYDPDSAYLIVSFAENPAHARAFNIVDGAVTELTLVSDEPGA